MAVELDSQSNVVMPLGELPEGCIANTLSLTSPRDACRLSLVSSVFRSAELSDDVWERFLPPGYRDILGLSAEGVQLLCPSMSRRELYLHLCDHPILIDSGTKSFWLEKSSGKKCCMLAARDMTIEWSCVPLYWKWISLPQSRFSNVAKLRRVCWLEIRGAIKTSMLSPHTTYAAYLVFTTVRGFHGFEQPPVEASVGFSGQERQKQAVYLVPGVVGEQETDNGTPARHAQQRGDRWMEVELGEIFINGGEDVDLEIGLMEIKGGHWKSGLAIEGIEIRPKMGN